jgi:hypothetical protein
MNQEIVGDEERKKRNNLNLPGKRRRKRGRERKRG